VFMLVANAGYVDLFVVTFDVSPDDSGCYVTSLSIFIILYLLICRALVNYISFGFGFVW